jgi:hypothetical protein
MGSKKSLTQSFLVATGLIWVFNVVALVIGGGCMAGVNVPV